MVTASMAKPPVPVIGSRTVRSSTGPQARLTLSRASLGSRLIGLKNGRSVGRRVAVPIESSKSPTSQPHAT